MMVLMGMDLPLGAIRKQITSGVDIIVHLGRLRDKSRRVLEIAEVDNMIDGEINLNPLYVFEEESVEDGKIRGRLAPRNALCHEEKLRAAGIRP
jgi:pilus assembly protein CpaF